MDNPMHVQRKFNEKMLAQIPLHARDCTVPIVIAHNGAIHQFGTGTLFRIADYFFLVTAGHVIKDACKHGKTLGIGASDKGSFIALTGDSQVSSAGQYGTTADPLDIALHRLPSDAVARIEQKRFLLFADIEFDEQSPTAVYMLFGFPSVWSSKSSSAAERVAYKALEYTTFRYNRDTAILKEYQERLHLLLDAELSQSTDQKGTPAAFLDFNGVVVPFPRGLGGISGCSVWRIGDLTIDISDWRIEQSRLVAVQTGVYHSERVIKATRWIAVSTLIHEAYPELRPAMRLSRIHYP
jgi:hypothetical protein